MFTHRRKGCWLCQSCAMGNTTICSTGREDASALASAHVYAHVVRTAAEISADTGGGREHCTISLCQLKLLIEFQLSPAKHRMAENISCLDSHLEKAEVPVYQGRCIRKWEPNFCPPDLYFAITSTAPLWCELPSPHCRARHHCAEILN